MKKTFNSIRQMNPFKLNFATAASGLKTLSRKHFAKTQNSPTSLRPHSIHKPHLLLAWAYAWECTPSHTQIVTYARAHLAQLHLKTFAQPTTLLNFCVVRCSFAQCTDLYISLIALLRLEISQLATVVQRSFPKILQRSYLVKNRLRFLCYFLLLALSACSSVSGLDSNAHFSCPAPDGVSCTSVSTIFSSLFPSKSTDKPTITNFAGVVPKLAMSTPSANRLGQNIVSKSQERTLRIWLAPYKDQDGDLYDQHYIYVSVAPGIWSIPANPPLQNLILPTIHSVSKKNTPLDKNIPDKPNVSNKLKDSGIDALNLEPL